jgi:hypothetical protein
MQARLIAAKLIAALVVIFGAGLSLPSYSQTVAYPPPFVLGMASGAQFGAQVSAMNPAIHCAGGRSFSCTPHFSGRPILAGALIGGLISALTTPVYYGAPYMPDTSSMQYVPYPASVSAVGASPIADNWLQTETPRGDSAASSQFIESWQKFFEPVR